MSSDFYNWGRQGGNVLYPKRLGDEWQGNKLPVQTAGEKLEEGQQDKNLLIEKIGKRKDISNKSNKFDLSNNVSI